MCELFAMSSRVPSALNYSLHEFAKHGGLEYANKSGWGIAFFDGPDAFMVKEALPASDSPLAQYIASDHRESDCVIAHVRMASVGKPALKNTHPYRRALGRHTHVFAHNGTLAGIHSDYDLQTLGREPIGDTDSELAFCVLMDRMKPVWDSKTGITPTVDARLTVFSGFCSEMRQRGSANFLYSDGEVLFVHAHKRKYEENDALSDARAPGLSLLNCNTNRQNLEFNCNGLNLKLNHPDTLLVASVPLDNSDWDPLPEAVALAIQGGTEVGRVQT